MWKGILIYPCLGQRSWNVNDFIENICSDTYKYILCRVVCPNFRHPALFSSFTKYIFFQVKIVFQNFWMDCQFLNYFSLRGWFIIFVAYAYSIYKVRKPRMTNLGQGVEVRAHYPISYILIRCIVWGCQPYFFYFVSCPKVLIGFKKCLQTTGPNFPYLFFRKKTILLDFLMHFCGFSMCMMLI